MTYNVSPELADRLLDLLAESDDFRARFEADALSCFIELGWPLTMDINGASPPTCLATKHLAPKAVIRETRDALRRQLVEQKLIHNPIGLQAAGAPTAKKVREYA